MVNRNVIGFVLLGLMLVSLAWFLKPVLADDRGPTGANVTFVKSERAPNDTAGHQEAQAGNITHLTIFGYVTTQAWQGYVGNVSGVIRLADANDNVLYNWSLAQPEGEVYASTNSHINWRKIQCFNYSATGELDDTDEVPGGVNAKGMNLSMLHAAYNISWDDVDSVNETFYLYNQSTGAGIGPAEGHGLFFTTNYRFSNGTCVSTRLYTENGRGEKGKFEEVIQYEPETNSVIWTSIIHEESVNGYDGQDHDFQMIVLNDQHYDNTATTRYYFFVELE